MEISCIIVEDEPLARSLLEQYVLKVPQLKLLKSFANPIAALEFLRNNTVDVLFSDIQMPEITGITLLKILQKKPIVILTTAYSEYALEGYELDVMDYLLKPITFERFLKAIEKINQRMNPPIKTEEKTEAMAQDFIFVKDGTKLVRVNFQDVLYIEGLKDYVRICTKDKQIVSLQTMKSLETLLPANQFVRVHNSYIVSLNAITVVEKDTIFIEKNSIPISDTYKKNLKDYIESKSLGRSFK